MNYKTKEKFDEFKIAFIEHCIISKKHFDKIGSWTSKATSVVLELLRKEYETETGKVSVVEHICELVGVKQKDISDDTKASLIFKTCYC